MSDRGCPNCKGWSYLASRRGETLGASRESDAANRDLRQPLPIECEVDEVRAGTVWRPREALRVLHFVHAMNGRTIADVAKVLAARMTEDGCEATVVAVRSNLDAAQTASSVDTVVLGSERTWRTTGSVAALRRVIRRMEPDVVFAHGNAQARALILATRGLPNRPCLVGIEHNHYSSYAWDHRRIRDQLNRLLLPKADAIIGVSPGIVEDLAEVFPRLADRIAVVPPPLTRYDRIRELAAEPVDHKWFEDPEIPIVTTVGHVHPRKDHQTLVRAMARLRTVAGPSAARLVIVGSTEGPEAERVRSVIAELGLSDQVDLVGAQANPLRFVARSAVFALSSRNEGMPLVILEAMAVGVPVVSTDCPSGPSWILEDGTRGLLTPVGDEIALGDALARLLGDSDLRDKFGRWGVERAAEFSPAEIASRYLAVASNARGVLRGDRRDAS